MFWILDKLSRAQGDISGVLGLVVMVGWRTRMDETGVS
jgi:hypothetical protein